MEKEKEKRFAVLIDADNVASKYVKYILDEVSNYGVVTYKRVYGDWTRPNLESWKGMALENAITPIQQYSYTTGKNSTDSAMIIDAMDILYSHNVDGFCIVSSDSDFTRLAIRLRESGMQVIGMGEKKTPKPFSTACNAFKYLEMLAEEDEEIQQDGRNKEIELETLGIKDLERIIIRIIAENGDMRGEMDIGHLANLLQNRYPDFDVRNYGYSKFSRFLKMFDSIESRQVNNKILVSQKFDEAGIDKIKSIIIDIVKSGGNKGYNLGQLKEQLCAKVPNFSVKTYGYSKFSLFVENLHGLKIKNNIVTLAEKRPG